MRKANMKDIFVFSRLIKQLNLKDDIFNLQKSADDVEKIGFELMYTIFDKATTNESEKLIYEALASPFEMSAKEVSEMGFEEFIDGFVTCFDFSSLLNFIKRAEK